MWAAYMLKSAIGLIAGAFFWFFGILVFMVYSFMPITKLLRQNIFTIVFPILYLVIMNLLIKKWFHEKGWKSILINTVILIATAAFSLLVLDLGSRIFSV